MPPQGTTTAAPAHTEGNGEKTEEDDPEYEQLSFDEEILKDKVRIDTAAQNAQAETAEIDGDQAVTADIDGDEGEEDLMKTTMRILMREKYL